MNSKRRNVKRIAVITLAVCASMAAGYVHAAESKGLDTEYGYEIAAMKAKGLQAPAYVQSDGSRLVVSDLSAGGSGGIFAVAMSGAVTSIAAVKHPGGLAVAPAGFGSYAGQIFVIAPTGDDKSACHVVRIDKSGKVDEFAKLPNAGSENGGVAADCRDMEFGTGGSFANKLYAVAGANSTIYEIDSSAKVRAFGTFDSPAWDLTAIGFTTATDTKAPNSMLIGTRPVGMGPSAKIGRINVINGQGKMLSDPYMTGFIRPTGFAYSPQGWGSYGGVLMIVDSGASADKNSGERDGRVYRVDNKGIAREFSSGMVDPNCMKFAGKTMLIADPSESGTKDKGAIITLKSQL